MDRLQAIEAFIKVAELRSFTRAAEALNISRTSASDLVKELEQRLGVRLLQRTTRRVSLTEPGAAFLARVRLGLAAIEEAEIEAADLALHPRGVLRVNAPMSFGFRHLAPAIGAFLIEYPDIKIELTLNDRVVDLLAENVDLAIRIGVLSDSTLIARKLATTRMLLCAAPSYLRHHGAPKHPRDLAQRTCLTFAYWSEGQNWRFTRRSSEVVVRIESRLWCNNGDAVVEAAAQGLGIALQPNFIAGPLIRQGRLVQILPGWRAAEIGVFALYPPSEFVPAKSRVFLDHLAGWLAQNPWD
jgi:DNA-binding transcriptional LysR family regulator